MSGLRSTILVGATGLVGAAVSSALQREVGAEVAKVQAKARARVDSLVAQQVTAACAKVTAIQSDLQTRLGAQQQQLQDVQTDLGRRLQDRGQAVPGLRLRSSVRRIRPQKQPSAIGHQSSAGSRDQ